MAKREILAGATDQTIDVFILDSSSTVGAGLTGLVYNTASLVCYYRKGATGTPTALTLATQTVGGAHSDGGFVAVDGTNCPGQYRLDLSDTIVATAGMVTVYLRGATNMAPCVTEIEVVSVNKFDSVRMGLTALPNAAADAAGGLVISDAGGLDADAQRSDVAAILVDTGTTLDGRIPAALVSGRMDASVGAMAANVVTAAAVADGAIDAATFASDALYRMGVLSSGTMQAGSTATTAVLAAATSFADDLINGCIIVISGGTGVGQVRVITDWVSATDTATVSTWTTTPDNTSTYVLFASPVSDPNLAAILAAVDTEVNAIKLKTDNLPEGIQKATALNNFEFEMVDSTDHVTEKTGLTVTATRSIDGGAFAACANAVTEVGNGTYKINLATTDLDGDFITLRFTATGADATKIGIKTEL